MFINQILNPVIGNIVNRAEMMAFHIDGKSFSYGQFGRRICALRPAIRSVDSEIVGLVIRDDLDTYASIFALWMEGRAYVPLNPLQPEGRNYDIIRQVGIRYLIDSDCSISFSGCERINPSLWCDSLAFEKPIEVSDESLAYILFTSGSTGVPKGVQISRRNIASFMYAFWLTGIHISPEDRCLQCFDLTFDVSVQSFLSGLTRGACVYTVPYGQVKYLYVASLINSEHITFGAMAPSMLTFLKPYFQELDLSSLRQCILTAEACPISLLEELMKHAPELELYDFYGPTEATIYCTYYKLTRGGENKTLNGIVSIGHPLSGIIYDIVDEDGRSLPVGEKGELIIAGDQLTPGYWRNDEKNRMSFFCRNGMRFYHTGDLCFSDSDGCIMYSGRIDQQAKIQGFRVELGEIEHHARVFFSESRRVIAVAFENEAALTEIAMFVEGSEDPFLDTYLRSKVPCYMVPTRYVFLESLPLNKNEKIDRVALKSMLKNGKI